MNARGDPLAELIAELPEDDLERTARSISACHRLAAGRATKRQDTRAARFHQRCAGDVLRALREIDQ